MASRNWRRDAIFHTAEGLPCVDFFFRNPWAREWAPGGPRHSEDLNRFVTAIDDRLFLALSPDTSEHKPVWHVLRYFKLVDREAASLIGRYYDQFGYPRLEVDIRLTEWLSEIDSQICGPDEKKRRLDKFRAEYEKSQAVAREEERAEVREEIFCKVIPEIEKGDVAYSQVPDNIA